MNVRALARSFAFAALLAPLVAGLAGCWDFGCGVSPVPDNADGGSNVASVNAAGEVVFSQEIVGAVVTFAIPVYETATGQSETLLGASLEGTGKDAFTVLTTFPIEVPADGQASVTVQFSPGADGTFTAQLDLQTQKMGVSTIPLTGTGVSPTNQ